MSTGLSEEQYQRLRNDIKQEVITEVKEEIGDELRSANEVEVRSDEDNAGLSDIWIAGNPVGTLLDKALRNSSDAKKTAKQARAVGSSDSEPTGNDGENDSDDDEITTLERIADDDQDDPAGVRVTPSVTRAASVMKHWFDWSKKARKGRNIKDGLKKLIETATGESLAWRQVYRACKTVESLTKGKIVFFKHDRHGWMLLQPSSVTTG
jgi:hypothetical protein